jgi:hypothetical protein
MDIHECYCHAFNAVTLCLKFFSRACREVVPAQQKISMNYGHNSHFAPIGRGKRKLTQIKSWQDATNIGSARIARIARR